MIALTVPAFVEGQTVVTLAEPLTVLCQRCDGYGVRWDDMGCHCSKCTDGRVPYRGRVVIAVACSTCRGKGVSLAFYRYPHRSCPDCDGKGALIVASAVAARSVPIVGDGEVADAPVYVEVVDGGEVYLWRWSDDLGDHERGGCLADDPAWEAERGRWAVLLADVKPTNERCPECWGGSFVASGWITCRTCQGDGTCPPILAALPLGVGEWTP